MLELILAGFLAGIVSGLIPGIHVNLLVLAIPFLPSSFAIFLVSMAITHTFIDFIPSILQGSPIEDKNLLPSQKFFLQGKARKAILLTVFGGFFSVLFLSLLILPLLFFLPFLNPFLPILTIFVLLFFIAFLLDSPSPLPLFLSAWLGLIAFSSFSPNMIFCLISGFFGLGTNLHILLSPKTQVFQTKETLETNINPNFLPMLFSSFIVSLFPGIGTANAYSLSGKIKKYTDSEKMFIAGGTNTAAAIFSLIVLFSLNKTRTGLTIMLQQMSQISPETIFLFFSTILFVSSLSSLLILHLPIFSIRTKKLNLLIILFLSILAIFFSGFYGFLIFLTAGAIGLLTILLNTRRSTNMASIIVPVLSHYLF